LQVSPTLDFDLKIFHLAVLVSTRWLAKCRTYTWEPLQICCLLVQAKQKNVLAALSQGCQIFLSPNIQNVHNIPNDHKIYPKSLIYTKWP
jgi:hypothetical protein